MDRNPDVGEHGLIGDLQTAALVSTDGTIDWPCEHRNLPEEGIWETRGGSLYSEEIGLTSELVGQLPAGVQPPLAHQRSARPGLPVRPRCRLRRAGALDGTARELAWDRRRMPRPRNVQAQEASLSASSQPVFSAPISL
jgi:hypothetical protein